MAKPLVAIVGRPNVGKSTFFNTMAGRRVSIVENTPGVTRDRVYLDCEWQNYKFTLIDTGGIDPTSEDPLLQQMRRQAEIAIETCDVILFFVDGKTGMTADDQSVADMLRKAHKPILLVVNKKAEKQYGAKLRETFQSTEEKTVWIEKSSRAMYPSDQAGFPMSAAVAAMKKLPLLGLYLDRIHTGRDRVFDERNIEYLCKSTIDFLSSAEGGKQYDLHL